MGLDLGSYEILMNEIEELKKDRDAHKQESKREQKINDKYAKQGLKLQEQNKIQISINNQLLKEKASLQQDVDRLQNIIKQAKTVYGFTLADEVTPTVWGSIKTEFDTFTAKVLDIKEIK